MLHTDPEGVERLVAYVSPATVDVLELEDILRDYLPSFLVPYIFQLLPRLPLTLFGEVRACLEQPFSHISLHQSHLKAFSILINRKTNLPSLISV